MLAAVALVAGAGFAACQKSTPQVAAMPLDTGAAAPLGEAPPPGGLPPAPPARVGALADYHDAYAYPDRAWGMSGAFGDSPPDYAFYDDGVTPWVWVADDDSECLAEPVPGGERYYYFEPGAYTPVLRAGSEQRLRVRQAASWWRSTTAAAARSRRPPIRPTRRPPGSIWRAAGC